MKWLAVGLFCVSFPAQAQQPVPGPVEGANVVAVLLVDSGAVAWARTAQLLTARGYHVPARDAAALWLETEPRRPPEGCFTSLRATVMGHTVLLSGTSRCVLVNHLPHPLWYSAQSHVPFANFDCYAWGWDELLAVAQGLSGRKIVSFRRP